MKSLSRRTLNGRALLMAVSSLVLQAEVIGRAKADTLASQASVSYQAMPSDGQQCSGCRNFIPGASGSCKVVAGTISPTGYCVAFEPV
jgi:hypothetical protein